VPLGYEKLHMSNFFDQQILQEDVYQQIEKLNTSTKSEAKKKNLQFLTQFVRSRR